MKVLFWRANRRARRGDFQQAIELYSSILKIAGVPLVLRLRGIALGTLGRHEEAISDFDEGLALDPRFTLCYLERGVAKSERGDVSGALEDFEAALRLEPSNYSAIVSIAWMKRKLGAAAEAFAGFEGAAKLKPELGEAWAGMGLIEFDRKALESAARYAKKAIALGGLDKELKVELAKIKPMEECAHRIDPSTLPNGPHL